MTNKATNFDAQTQKAKLRAIKKIVKIVPAEGWDYWNLGEYLEYFHIIKQ
jgi:hypothetical protein